MIAAVGSAWALLLGLALLMIGNGLQGTVVGLRATLEGFATGATGLVMTGYFAGFLAGSTIVPRLVGNVGHVRVFAALASAASGVALLHAVFVGPIPWFGFRLVTGFCYAGLYVVAESWLNDAATNETRGQLLSVYMVIVLAGMGGGQLLLNVADPLGFEPFVLISVLVSAALVPITLSVGRAPSFEQPESVSLRELYRASPLGVVGAFAVGISHAGLFGMGAVYATMRGLTVQQISVFMALPLLGGMLLQWPIGWLSDRFDRRRIITLVTWLACVCALAAMIFGRDSLPTLLTAVFFFGGTALPLYSLCGAHTNDFLAPQQMVAASSTLILIGGVGLTFGPGVAALAIELAGPQGLFAGLAMVHAFIGSFALYRMTRREARPLDEQRHYQAMPLRTSPVAAAIAVEAVRDHGDRGVVRWRAK